MAPPPTVGVGRRIRRAAGEVRQLHLVRVDRHVPPLGQRLERAHVVEVAVREHDRRRARVGPEAHRGRRGDPLGGALQAGVDEHPAAVARVARPDEEQVDHHRAEVRDVRGDVGASRAGAVRGWSVGASVIVGWLLWGSWRAVSGCAAARVRRRARTRAGRPLRQAGHARERPLPSGLGRASRRMRRPDAPSIPLLLAEPPDAGRLARAVAAAEVGDERGVRAVEHLVASASAAARQCAGRVGRRAAARQAVRVRAERAGRRRGAPASWSPASAGRRRRRGAGGAGVRGGVRAGVAAGVRRAPAGAPRCRARRARRARGVARRPACRPWVPAARAAPERVRVVSGGG
jgi:hypothetical protein